MTFPRRYIYLLIFFLFLLSFSLPFLFLLNRKTAYYAYKEVTYWTVINKVVGKEKNPEKICILLLAYLHDNLFKPSNTEIVDKDVYNDLIRGVAWCDQRSWALGTFLGMLGIDNRMVMTRNPEGASNHTVLEAFIDKKWRFFDPTYGIVVRGNGGLLSYEDICRDPSLFFLHPDMVALRKLNYPKYAIVKDYFTRNIFHLGQEGPAIWLNPRGKRDPVHNFISAIVRFYIRTFGDKFSYVFQDVYLNYLSPVRQRDKLAYFRARNYDLYSRNKLAIDLYDYIIAKYPDSPFLENTLFFKGFLYHRSGDFEKSIDSLSLLLKKIPATKWQRISCYLLGYDYELLNKITPARDYYQYSVSLYNQLRSIELKPSELKTFRRLYGILCKEQSAR